MVTGYDVSVRRIGGFTYKGLIDMEPGGLHAPARRYSDDGYLYVFGWGYQVGLRSVLAFLDLLGCGHLGT